MTDQTQKTLFEFKSPLTEGIFLQRYKRFFADVRWAGATQTVHVANSGSMEGCKHPESRCLVSDSLSLTRKLRHTLEAVRNPADTCWIGVNTAIPNKLVPQIFRNSLLPAWAAFDQLLPEAKISDSSRMDFAFWNSRNNPGWIITPKNRTKLWKSWMANPESSPRFHFVEVKNVSLAKGSIAQFPDSVTERGQKHIEDLVELIEKGHSAELLFVIQRSDTDVFSPAHEIDPKYAKMLAAAAKAGVKITPAQVDLSKHGIRWKRILPFQTS